MLEVKTGTVWDYQGNYYEVLSTFWDWARVKYQFRGKTKYKIMRRSDLAKGIQFPF